jgi:hypothetical protein
MNQDDDLHRKIRLLNAASKRFLGVDAVTKLGVRETDDHGAYAAAIYNLIQDPIVVAYGISEGDALTALEEILKVD